ncbi:MAG: bifunctional riboflavin kinase/FAD synthetase [Candidatus Zapsychrus exili]|nr:bifunctional riboflavin kinase/FAD synthetase [Candidatus Zapsychrus exili]
MKVVYGSSNIVKSFKRTVLVVGVFDGLHLGHQALIKKAVNKAKRIKGTSMLMTFSPHPMQVLHPNKKLKLMISLDYRLKIIEQLGIDVAIVISFTKAFAHLTPEKFVDRYLVKKIKPVDVFVGDDFRFGGKRKGTLEYFKEAGSEYGFKVDTVHPICFDKKHELKISSTDIRSLIADGKLDQASKFLGRPVSFMGKVVKGAGRGKKIGYPTINVCPKNKIYPPAGVYAVKILKDKNKHNGMANVGIRPFFNKNKNDVNIEVNIFDFKENIYGKSVVIEFYKKIREEKTFPTLKRLIDQIKRDEKKIRPLLK